MPKASDQPKFNRSASQLWLYQGRAAADQDQEWVSEINSCCQISLLAYRWDQSSLVNRKRNVSDQSRAAIAASQRGAAARSTVLIQGGGGTDTAERRRGSPPGRPRSRFRELMRKPILPEASP